MSHRAAADPHDHNDPHLHLFIDDAEIARMENLQRVINRLRKRDEPVIVPDKPWEGDRVQAWGSVIRETGGPFRMWYLAVAGNSHRVEHDRGGYCYAESRDGIHWEKPDLGLVEFRGSRKNNFVYTCAPDGKNLEPQELARRGLGLPATDASGARIGVVNNLDGYTVVRDDDEPDPQRRYKLIANMQDNRMWRNYDRAQYPNVTDEQLKAAQAVFGQYLDTSPDGIHWARKPRKMLPASGDYMMVTRDYRNRRWWLNERAPTGKGIRNAALRTGMDWVHWSKQTVCFDNDQATDFGKAFEWHGGMTPFNYGNLNLGLLEKWPFRGMGATCELIVNREGAAWQRVAPEHPFLDTGPEGNFDHTLAFPTHNSPIRVGDELFIFYTGGGVKKNANEAMPMGIGLATVPIDRFAGLAQWRAAKPGVVVTKPLEIPGGKLEVNAELLEDIPMKVAVTTPDGEALSGYALEDCEMDYDAKRPRSPVRWKSKPDLQELRGKTLSLHFQVPRAVLYSYRFAEL